MSDGIRDDGRLDISPGCRNASTMLCRDRAVIESVMLWPNDVAARRRGLQTLGAWVDVNHPDLVGYLFTREQVRAALETEPLSNIATTDLYRHGMICGFILRETVGRIKSGYEGASIGEVIKAVSEAFSTSQHISVSTINNRIWPKYKSVCHLWAAHVDAWIDDIDMEFPCHFSRIADFLSLAESYRVLGETTRTRQSPNAPIPPGVAICLPFAVPLATVEFSQANGKS